MKVFLLKLEIQKKNTTHRWLKVQFVWWDFKTLIIYFTNTLLKKYGLKMIVSSIGSLCKLVSKISHNTIDCSIGLQITMQYHQFS